MDAIFKMHALCQEKVGFNKHTVTHCSFTSWEKLPAVMSNSGRGENATFALAIFHKS
jgi:hypothetical protein